MSFAVDRDSLRVVCSFLTWPDLLTFSHCSRTVRAAAVNSQRRNCMVEVDGQRLEYILKSDMRKHIAYIHNDGDMNWWHLIPQIADRLPWVARLMVGVPLKQLRQVSRYMPNGLKKLTLVINCDGLDDHSEGSDEDEDSFDSEPEDLLASALDGVMADIATSAPQLSSLAVALKLKGTFHPDDLMVPPSILQQIARHPTITELKLPMDQTNSEIIKILRSMKQLRQVRSWRLWWDASDLSALTVGHVNIDYPPLEAIDNLECNDDTVAAILKLPSLTELRLDDEDEPSNPSTVLMGLPNLISLSLQFDSPNRVVRIVDALKSMSSRSKLRVLALSSEELNDAQLTEILSGLPQLIELRASNCIGLRSFKVFNSAAPQLEVLSLSRCDEMQVEEWIHLRALTKLRFLRFEVRSHFGKELPDEFKQYVASLQTPAKP